MGSFPRRIPRDAYARREADPVAVCIRFGNTGVTMEQKAGGRIRIDARVLAREKCRHREMLSSRKLVMLGKGGLPPQADVYIQPACQTNVVLHVGANIHLTQADIERVALSEQAGATQHVIGE